ncbi:MAG: asparagine synthase (glutamine-hydrolyzing) [Burkholderiales bacterium]
MCGITGYWARDLAQERWAGDLRAATDALAHRGPDDQGWWIDPARGEVGLGHRRLAIVDLSAHGHQPMLSRCGQWVMVFNGEIYNFAEIRPELEALGHRFAGTGDSEVILAAFAQWGPAAVRRFVGMFAIALWSVAQRKLYLLRDRLGVKPLYFRWDGKVLLFGSELKALRAFSGWQPEVDREALADYFRYGYIVHPRSIYRQVFQLQPGCWLELAATGEPRLERYWNVLDSVVRSTGQAEEALTDELEALLVSAFNYRMIADVPVGVFLSGGIDSSILAALLQKHATGRIKTFTIGFDEAEFNEAPFAEAVAAHLGTEQHTRILSVDRAMSMLPAWGDLFDEPFGDSSGIPTLLVSQVASEQVKVVLSADGGDELFSGYNSYTSILAQRATLERLPSWVRDSAHAGLGLVPWQGLDDWLAERQWGDGRNHALRYGTTVRMSKIRERLATHTVGEMLDQALQQCFWPDHELGRLIGAAPRTRRTADAYPGTDGEKLCLWDLQHYLPGDVLTKVDRATMRASIEGRDPLIDHRVVEFAFSLPFDLRRGTLGSKHLLRKVLYRHVPRELIERPKRGFGIPLGRWLSGGMRQLVDQHLEPSRVRRQGLLDPSMVEDVLRRFRAGDKLSVNKVWLLLAFQMWHARWMEGLPAPVAGQAAAASAARRPEDQELSVA